MKENTNLVEEDETKDEGTLMMANKGINLHNNMVWYLHIGASNHMCEQKHLFVVSQEIKDGHALQEKHEIETNFRYQK